jgi:hypothetical protein
MSPISDIFPNPIWLQQWEVRQHLSSPRSGTSRTGWSSQSPSRAGHPWWPSSVAGSRRWWTRAADASSHRTTSTASLLACPARSASPVPPPGPAQQRCSERTMVDAYVSLYRELAGGHDQPLFHPRRRPIPDGDSPRCYATVRAAPSRSVARSCSFCRHRRGRAPMRGSRPGRAAPPRCPAARPGSHSFSQRGALHELSALGMLAPPEQCGATA